MNTDPAPQKRQSNPSPAQDITRKAQRLNHSRTQPARSPLRGLGAFGVIGWSVAVPTVAGALLGLWLNKVYPQPFSWPVALILGGVVLGLMVAWEWVARQQRDEERDAQRAQRSVRSSAVPRATTPPQDSTTPRPPNRAQGE